MDKYLQYLLNGNYIHFSNYIPSWVVIYGSKIYNQDYELTSLIRVSKYKIITNADFELII
ncbi:unnamed protein product [Paramecium sonneborni]|uniref:Uncharacterized protein n=1 Tax=Paramecium sonneborni TaxID=65129 RepID=A0A8S1N3T4_9CILI|nr:unnamed protein product [Paramecium sonneborni]